MTKGMMGTAGLIAAAVLFVALNSLGGRALKGARLDLTEGNLYTLSDGTRNILSDIDEPIRLTFYYSRGLTDQVPEITGYAKRVNELLDEYVLASDGQLQLRVVDPAPFSEEEDEAVSAGIQGLPIPPAGDLFYFGLVATNAVDESQVIPFFDPNQEPFLEYELSRFVHQLDDPAVKRLAVLAGLPVGGSAPPPQMPGQPPQPPMPGWYLVELLRESYDVDLLEPTATEIPAGTDVLLVVHPKAFSDDTLYAVDQFVLGGGSALVMVDPRCEEDAPPPDQSNPFAGMNADQSSDLGPLLQAWGVAFDPQQVTTDRSSALYVSTGAQGRPDRTPYVAWMELAGDCLDADDPTTSGLGGLVFAGTGSLGPLEGAASTFTTLVRTTEDSSFVMVEDLAMFPYSPSPQDLLTQFVPGGERQTVIARVTGEASSAYPDGPPGLGAAEEAAEGPPAPPPGDHLTASEGPLHVIVVADADFGADRWWVQFQSFFGARMPIPTASNGDFLLNAIDSLAGSSDLLDVRGRGRYERPFQKIEELRRLAEQRYLDEEQRLQEELRETERRINELQSQREETASLILTPEQAEAIEGFQTARVETRKKLRAVKHDLSKDIDGLQDALMFANTLGTPLLVLLAALGAWWSRGRS
jgi:ABC-type uncharacterized transport system involved in gliding motility auxiliary subunit